MKRWLLILAAWLLCCVGAFAEAGNVLRIRESQREFETAWEQEGIKVPYERTVYDWRVPLSDLLLDENSPDLMYVRTGNDNFEALIQQGLLADLSIHAAIRANIAALRPGLRALLTAHEGKIYGVPHAMTIQNAVYWLPASWSKAGLLPESAPTSFEELLDFLDAYVDHGGREGCTVLRIRDDQDQRRPTNPYSEWLVSVLLDAWTVQAWAAEEKETFQSAEFVSWLHRALAVGKKLNQWEGNTPDEEKVPLFYRGSGRGTTGRANETYTLDNLVPARLTNDQPLLLPIRLQMLCVRQGSPWQETAAAMAAAASRTCYAWSALLLYSDADPTAFNQSAVDPAARFTREWLESIDAFSGVMTAPVCSITAEEGYYAALARLISGQMQPGDFAEYLDQTKQ